MKKLTRGEFIERAKTVHGDKYNYSKVKYIDYNTKVCIICKKHGEFWQTPHNHVSGAKCPKCSGKYKCTTAEWIEKAREVHGDKYDYSKVEYVNAFTKVCIICPKHGEFWQKPNCHLSGDGCRECFLERKRKTLKEFIKKAKLIHGDKYDYFEVEYINVRTKVCIICPQHGKFWQTPSTHLSGRGCPICKESTLERNVENFLTENAIKYERGFKNKWLDKQHLDFYLPQYNIAIECQGIQHFKPKSFGGHENVITRFENDKRRDNLKIKKCKENGVTLIHYNPFKEYYGTYENEIHSTEELEKILL